MSIGHQTPAVSLNTTPCDSVFCSTVSLFMNMARPTLPAGELLYKSIHLLSGPQPPPSSSCWLSLARASSVRSFRESPLALPSPPHHPPTQAAKPQYGPRPDFSMAHDPKKCTRGGPPRDYKGCVPQSTKLNCTEFIHGVYDVPPSTPTSFNAQGTLEKDSSWIGLSQWCSGAGMRCAILPQGLQVRSRETRDALQAMLFTSR